MSDRLSDLGVYRYRIPLPPHAKQRPRATRQGRSYTPAVTREWETDAAVLVKSQHLGPCIDWPVRVVITGLARAPARAGQSTHRRWRIGRTDVDNEAKATLDALQKAGVLSDDRYVVSLTCEKRYTAASEPEGVEVSIYPAS